MGPIIAIPSFAWLIYKFSHPMQRIGASLTIAGVLFILYRDRRLVALLAQDPSVAAGVDDPATAEILRKAGVRYAQGVYFNGPVPPMLRDRREIAQAAA